MAKWIYESEAKEKTYCPVPNFNNEDSALGTSKCMGGKCGAWNWLKDSDTRDRSGYNYEARMACPNILTHGKDCDRVEGHYETTIVSSWVFWTKEKKTWIHEKCTCVFLYDCSPDDHPEIRVDEQGMCGIKK